jgi:hypothetical protein
MCASTCDRLHRVILSHAQSAHAVNYLLSQVNYAPVIEIEIALRAGIALSGGAPRVNATGNTTNGTNATNATNATGPASTSKKIVVDGSEIFEDRVDPGVQLTIPASNTLRPITAINILLLETQTRIASLYPRFLRITTEGGEAGGRIIIPSTYRVNNSFMFYHNQSNVSYPADYLGVHPECTGCPKLNQSGELTFELAPHQYGVATVTFKVTSMAAFSLDSSKEILFDVDFVVMPVNQPPFAVLPSSIGVAERTQPAIVIKFATQISVGPVNEAWQTPIFAVRVESDTRGLFAQLPQIDREGTLKYQLAEGAHGTATLTVSLTDDGGREYGGKDAAVGYPRTVEFRVYPMPQITSVSPCVGPGHLPMVVTVRGRYFGSEYFRGASEVPLDPAGVSALLSSEKPCENFRMITDSEFVCTVPPAFGRQSMSVVMEGGTTENGDGQTISTWTRAKTYLQVSMTCVLSCA